MQKDVHLLTADEKTVVLSRERFAADNRAPRSLRTSPTLASKPFDRTARVWKKIRDQIFRKSCSKIYLFRLPWNGILSWERHVYYCERKLRLVFPDYKYKYYGFDVVNSNFTITRLVFIYDYKHTSRATILTNIISLRNTVVPNKRTFRSTIYKLIMRAILFSFFPLSFFHRPYTSLFDLHSYEK